jgi:hypothetical protein
MRNLTYAITVLLPISLWTACGEPTFENAGSQASLLEDREACAAEMNNSPAADAYRQNPDAHPEYPMNVFNEMNRCIERKGWRQVGSQQEQERMREAIMTEVGRRTEPVTLSDPSTTERLKRAIERKFTTSVEAPRSQP